MNCTLLSEFKSLTNDRTTRLKIQTLGFFYGRLVKSGRGNPYYEIKILIIPKQTGFSNKCKYTCDDLICYLHNLTDCDVLLGWIHSQPYNNACLSSIDIHESLYKQENTRSAVNIVYSQKNDSFSAFHLMVNKVHEIKKCKKIEFHGDHNNSMIYCNSDHIKIINGGIFSKIFNLLNGNEYIKWNSEKIAHDKIVLELLKVPDIYDNNQKNNKNENSNNYRNGHNYNKNKKLFYNYNEIKNYYENNKNGDYNERYSLTCIKKGNDSSCVDYCYSTDSVCLHLLCVLLL